MHFLAQETEKRRNNAHHMPVLKLKKYCPLGTHSVLLLRVSIFCYHHERGHFKGTR